MNIDPRRRGPEVLRFLFLLCVRLIGVGLQMAIVLLVGRLAGPQGVGIMQLFTAWTCSLGELSAMGLPTHAMKTLAKISPQGDRSRVRQFVTDCTGRISLTWFALLSAGAVALSLQAAGVPLGIPLWLQEHAVSLALAVIAFAIMRFSSESLKARGQIHESVFTENAGPPFFAALWLVTVWWLDGSISAPAVVHGLTAGFLLTSVVLLGVLVRHVRGMIPAAPGPALDISWHAHTPFWVTALISITFLNFPFLVMPHFASIAEVGVFSVAFKLLNIITTLLILIAALFGPDFARHEATGNFKAAHALLVRSQWVSVLLYAPIVACLLVFFDEIHPFFGEGFGDGFRFLLIIATGQAINAATGLAGVALNMLGQGKKEMMVQAGTLLFACLLAPIAGQHYGAAGIAASYSITMALKSVLSYLLVKRFLHQQINRDTSPQRYLTGVAV